MAAIFKLEKSENLDNAFYIFTFFDMTLQKTSKVAFWDLKHRKRIPEQ